MTNTTPTSFPTPRFVVQSEGAEIGWFMEVSGLELEVGVETFREGGTNQFEYKLPKGISWPNIVLTRGLLNNDNLFNWVQKSSGDGFTGAGNKLKLATATIQIVDAVGKVQRSWNLEGAFPVKWKGPSFAVSSTSPATETLEIAHRGFTSKLGSG